MPTRSTAQLHPGHHQQQQFLRALSHDLGATLMLLEGSLGFLKQSLPHDSPPAVDESFSHVVACVQQAKQLLGDLARLARTGSIALEPARVELRPVVEDVLREHRQMLADRKIDVVIEDPLPAVWCHADRLKQVVTNLLRNAILHGCDAQRPQITIAAAPATRRGRASSGRRWAAFQVRDNGPGIEPSLHRKIFLPGWRAAPRGADGLGMGLAIVGKLVRQFGGKVYVDPACVRGAALVVVLPVPPEPVTEPLHEIGKQGRGATGRRRLQVDHGHSTRPAQFHGPLPAPAHRKCRS